MKQSRLAVFVLFITILLVFGLALAEQQDGEAAFDALRQQWEDLYNQGDAAGVANLYTEDAALYDSDGTVHEGRDAIQESLQGDLDAGFTEVSIESIETEVMNDTAYGIGSYMVTHEEGMTAEGYYMVVLRSENGEWRIHRHIANMVLPEDMMGQEQAATAQTETATETAEEETAEEETATETAEEGQRATVEVAEHDTHGEYLTDAEGRTLYLFLNDEQGESVCYDQCAENWPPLLTTDEAEAGEGVDSDLLGTTERQDGSMQVTYNDWPLYYFARDEAPGDVTGQGVGGNWYLVSPEGEAIEEE